MAGGNGNGNGGNGVELEEVKLDDYPKFKGSVPLGVELEEGWRRVAAAFAKMNRFLEGGAPEFLSAAEYICTHLVAYIMCTQRTSQDFSPQLYERHKLLFDAQINSTVVPSLREKQGEALAREFAERWTKHQKLAQWTGFLLGFLDRYHVPRNMLPPLKQVSFNCFRDLVFNEFRGSVTAAVHGMVEQHKKHGQHVDRDLIARVRGIYVEFGFGHELDFTLH